MRLVLFVSLVAVGVRLRRAVDWDHAFARRASGLAVLSEIYQDSAVAESAHGTTTVLRARHGWSIVNLGDIWRYRDLLLLLAMRDIQIRYKQTALGAVWAVLQPIAMMVVFTLFFGKLLDVNETIGPVPYAVFVFAGLLPWNFFSQSVVASSNSLVNNAPILTKVYFPRLLMPIAATGAPLVDYVVSFTVLVALMVYYQCVFSWQLLLLPVLVMSTFAAALSVSILLAGLTVLYRDFRHVVPFMVQVMFFLTPVIYPVSIIPERFTWILNLNPMFGPITAFRAAVLDQPINYGAWGISTVITLALLFVGLAYFGRAERQFADIV